MKYYQQARVVITTGGVGTLYELLHLNKSILVVSNSGIPDNHQSESDLVKENEDQYMSGSKTSQLKYQNEPVVIILPAWHGASLPRNGWRKMT
jgi:UDP-N-acetylglucosamine transferase subunit ALG13